jgi:hypothetical protein
MLKQNFFIQMLSGKGGNISSKRTVMVFFVLLYAYCLLVNVHTGKSPSPTFLDQLFQLVCLTLIAVVGEQLLNVLALLRGQKVNTIVTTVTPEPQNVTTVETTKEPVKP